MKNWPGYAALAATRHLTAAALAWPKGETPKPGIPKGLEKKLDEVLDDLAKKEGVSRSELLSTVRRVLDRPPSKPTKRKPHFSEAFL